MSSSPPPISSALALKTAKQEIKAWERSFRSERGREPTKEDIKALPELAAKYKLYRQLAKGATFTAKASTSTSYPGAQKSSTNAHASSSKTRSGIPTKHARDGSGGFDEDRDDDGDLARENGNGAVVPKRLFQTPIKSKPSAVSQASKQPNPILGLQTPPRPKPTSYNPFLSPSAAAAREPSATTPRPLLPSFSRSVVWDLAGHFTQSSTGRSGGKERNDRIEETAGRSSSSSRTTTSAPSIEVISNSPRRLKQVLDAASAEHRRSSHTSPARNGDGDHSLLVELTSATAGKGVTPRTRARKRLRGEEVEDTPGRAKVARSSLGGRRSSAAGNVSERVGEFHGAVKAKAYSNTDGLAVRYPGGEIRRTLSSGSGRVSRAITPEQESEEDGHSDGEDDGGQEELGRRRGARSVNEDQDEDEDEEIFGPTPQKASAGSKVSSGLFGISSSSSTAKRKLDLLNGKVAHVEPSGRSGGAGEVDDSLNLRSLAPAGMGKSQLMPSAPSASYPVKLSSLARVPSFPDPAPSPSSPSASKQEASVEEDDPDDLPEPIATALSPTEEEDAGLLDLTPSRYSKTPYVDEDLAHDVEWSSSEEDYFDDDGEERRARRVHKIRVEPYRLALQKKLAMQAGRATRPEEAEPSDDEEEMGNADKIEARRPHTDRSGRNMMSALSLASPQAKIAIRTERLHEARAKAVFDQKAKQKLRANRRPEVYLPGEAAHDVDTDGQAVKAEEEEGDDDWESDPDGWKAVGLPDDDDW